MKHLKKIAMGISLLIVTGGFAQSWMIGGNNVAGAGADRLFGIISPANKNLVFVNGNSGGVPIERGRITSDGLWGIGTSLVNAKLHVNSAAGETPFRVQINGSTKFYVNSNGGMSVGTTNTPPVNGILTLGNMRVGSGTFANDVKLQVLAGADVTVNSGGYFVAGQTGSTNVAIDDNEIMARNNGQPATLYLNANGGDVNINGGALTVWDLNDAVGIRNTLPEADLHMKHALGSGATNGFRIENEGASHNHWTMYVQNSNGNLELYKNGAFRGSFDDASGAYNSISDMRLKKNIENAGELLPKIMQLKVKKYHFLKNAETDKKSYGMLAQEVEKIFPEMVTHNTEDDGKDLYTMDYASFGVVAIKGIQEQQQLIDGLTEQATAIRQENKTLEEQLQKLETMIKTIGQDKMNVITNSSLTKSFKENISLEQNIPNPFNQTTTIRYSIPNNTTANIVIYNSNGTIVKSIKANNSGVAVIDAGGLAAGTYTYALMVNGQAATSRKMLLTK